MENNTVIPLRKATGEILNNDEKSGQRIRWKRHPIPARLKEWQDKSQPSKASSSQERRTSKWNLNKNQNNNKSICLINDNIYIHIYIYVKSDHK